MKKIKPDYEITIKKLAEIIFTFKDSLSATLFLPKINDQKTIILLMPVRIND